jgi:hypothetical protein
MVKDRNKNKLFEEPPEKSKTRSRAADHNFCPGCGEHDRHKRQNHWCCRSWFYDLPDLRDTTIVEGGIDR